MNGGRLERRQARVTASESVGSGFSINKPFSAVPACRRSSLPMFWSAAVFLFVTANVFAQGMLPGKNDAASPPPESPYILIGNVVPSSLTVTTMSGKTRTLVSYQPTNDDLVVCFLSTQCPQNQKIWPALKRLYQDYQNWHVTFVAVISQPGESAEELAQVMAKEGLPFTVVRDENQSVAKALKMTVVPEFAVLDDWQHLQYRGGLKSMREVLDAVIIHERFSVEPEPAVEGCPLP